MSIKQIEVVGVFKIKSGLVVGGVSSWPDEVILNLNDILACNSKQWKIVAIDGVHQDCFGVPTNRWHSLKLAPIGHSDQPNIKDILKLL